MNKLILLLFISFLLSSCSTEELNRNFGLFKNVESYNDGNKWLIEEVNNYTQDSLIQKMTIKAITYSENIYELEYENRKATSLNLSIVYDQPMFINRFVNYTISYNNNEITLTPTNSTVFKKIIIQNNSGFIDSCKIFYGDNAEYFTEEVFARNSNNDIESVSVYDTNQSGTNILVWVYTFSNFEQNVNLNPVYNPIFEWPWIDLIKVLNLNISNKNPTKSSRLSGSQSFDENYRTIEFIYDGNGFVTECTMNTIDGSNEYNFNYY